MHNGDCVKNSDDQKKTCEEIRHAYWTYSSNPTSNCSREVPVSEAIWWKCYVIWCVAIWRKNGYYNDDLLCSSSRENSSNYIWPLYDNKYCIVPSNPVVDYCKDKWAWVFHDASEWLIYITNWSNQCYIFQDKNLWASSPNSCWKYYQWWNNYGFDGGWTYSPSSTCETCKNPWGSSSNQFLWNTTAFNDYPTNSSWITNYQWPCPSGFHVPSLDDFSKINSLYNNLKSQNKATNWVNDIMVPDCGIMVWGGAGWSISTRVSHSDYGDGRLLWLRNGFDSAGNASAINHLWDIASKEPKRNGKQIRCMK